MALSEQAGMEPVLLSAEPDTLFRVLGSRVAVTRRATHCSACAALLLSDVPLCDSHVKVLSGELELETQRPREPESQRGRQRAREPERQRDRETECASDGTSATSERHCCRPLPESCITILQEQARQEDPFQSRRDESYWANTVFFVTSRKTEMARSVRGLKLQGALAEDALLESYLAQKILVT